MEKSEKQIMLASDVLLYFKNYREARERQVNIEKKRYPRGNFGIAVEKDELALEWQSYCGIIEKSRDFLEGRSLRKEVEDNILN